MPTLRSNENRIIKDTFAVFIVSVFAKLIGFFKTVIQASFFGANVNTDAYNMASGFVSNVLFMLTSALAVSFVPIYLQKKNEEGTEGAKRFATKTVTALLIFSLGVVAFLELAAPLIVKVVAPSYSGELHLITVKYFRVLALGFSFSLIASLCQNLLNAERVYLFSSACSLINSVVLILVIVTCARSLGIWALVIALPLSYLIQFSALLCRSRSYGRISLEFGIRDAAIKAIVIQSLPVLLSQATVEINQVVDRALLAGVEDGAVTSVSYAATLFQFVSGIIVLPLTTVLFTELAEAGAKGDMGSITRMLRLSYKVVVLLCLPITLITLFTSDDIVNIVFMHGKFDLIAAGQASIGLSAYILCLIPGAMKGVLSRAYYSLNDTKRPMWCGVFEVLLNIGLSLWLVRYYGILGIVGATAISTTVFTVVLSRNMRKVYLEGSRLGVWKDFLKIILSGLCLLLFLFMTRHVSMNGSLWTFIMKTVVGGGIYLLILYLLKDDAILYLTGIIKTKLLHR